MLNELDRRMIPCTTYPFSNSSSVRYDPSCPVIPVMRATFSSGSTSSRSMAAVVKFAVCAKKKKKGITFYLVIVRDSLSVTRSPGTHPWCLTLDEFDTRQRLCWSQLQPLPRNKVLWKAPQSLPRKLTAKTPARQKH